ncbi:unnamed protein product [Amoebophrya sp. A25]|nr:unnamed protein product [Amoebophrya sp. A25]|eukprot:GSA25T00026406001.1
MSDEEKQAKLLEVDEGWVRRKGSVELFLHLTEPLHTCSQEKFDAALARLAMLHGYRLTPCGEDVGDVGTSGTSTSIADNYLAIKNAHPRDAGLLFDEEQHKYTIKSLLEPPSILSSANSGASSSTQVRSVTSFCDSNGFNGNMIASKIIKSVRWSTDPSYEYYQQSKEEILRGWDFARHLGTELHRDIELYLNRKGQLEDHFLERKLSTKLELSRTSLDIFDSSASGSGGATSYTGTSGCAPSTAAPGGRQPAATPMPFSGSGGYPLGYGSSTTSSGMPLSYGGCATEDGGGLFGFGSTTSTGRSTDSTCLDAGANLQPPLLQPIAEEKVKEQEQEDQVELQQLQRNMQKEPDFIERTHFLAFVKDVLETRKWKPYRTEWRIYDAELKIAGTIDFVVEQDNVIADVSHHDIPIPRASSRTTRGSGTASKSKTSTATAVAKNKATSSSSSRRTKSASSAAEIGATGGDNIFETALRPGAGAAKGGQESSSSEVDAVLVEDEESGGGAGKNTDQDGKDVVPSCTTAEETSSNKRELILIDWKRTKQVKKAVYKNQLNLYRYLLEKNYVEFKVIEMYVVRLHPNSDTYDLVEIDLLPDEELKGLVGAGS